uniref:Ovule protein n=1 Tax=Heterorhabditis bacteriophora TaxID=37862 RepID=A0A1I7WFE5_HETBA
MPYKTRNPRSTASTCNCISHQFWFNLISELTLHSHFIESLHTLIFKWSKIDFSSMFSLIFLELYLREGLRECKCMLNMPSAQYLLLDELTKLIM